MLLVQGREAHRPSLGNQSITPPSFPTPSLFSITPTSLESNGILLLTTRLCTVLHASASPSTPCCWSRFLTIAVATTRLLALQCRSIPRDASLLLPLTLQGILSVLHSMPPNLTTRPPTCFRISTSFVGALSLLVCSAYFQTSATSWSAC